MTNEIVDPPARLKVAFVAAEPLACPFCGGAPTIEDDGIDTLYISRFLIWCKNKDCYIQPSLEGDQRANIIKKWNHRNTAR